MPRIPRKLTLVSTLLSTLALMCTGLASAQNASPAAAAPSYPRVTSYFGPADAANHAQHMPQPTPGGFYRMALGPDGKGCQRFQDFYQDSGERQSSELTTCDPVDLTRWELSGMQGLVLGYRPTGQMRSRQTLDQGLPHGRDFYYDDRGQVRTSVTWQHGKVHGPFRFKSLDGQQRIEGVAQQDTLKQIRAWDHGRRLSRDQAIALYNQARVSWFADMFR